MAIVVEDGTEVSGANSYISLADARTLLALYGQDLNATDATAEIELHQGRLWLEAYRQAFKGDKNNQDQALQWPRSNVWIDDDLFPNNEIPQELINAQVFAAYEQSQGNDLQGNSPGQSVAAEAVAGAVSIKYFDTGAIDGKTRFTRVMDELNILLRNGGITSQMRGARG